MLRRQTFSKPSIQHCRKFVKRSFASENGSCAAQHQRYIKKGAYLAVVDVKVYFPNYPYRKRTEQHIEYAGGKTRLQQSFEKKKYQR